MESRDLRDRPDINAVVNAVIPSSRYSRKSMRTETAGPDNVVRTSVRRTAESKDGKKGDRRNKLAMYLIEDLAKVYGQKKEDYMEEMNNIIAEAPADARKAFCDGFVEIPSTSRIMATMRRAGSERVGKAFDGKHSEPFTSDMVMIGEVGPSRQAWCKWWDRDSGCGELVDLDDQNTIAVVAAALTTAANVEPRLKYLRNGELVEFRHVHEKPPRAVLVRGIKGWPLMCEVGNTSLAAPAVQPPD